jgi:hypothetical protein
MRVTQIVHIVLSKINAIIMQRFTIDLHPQLI